MDFKKKNKEVGFKHFDPETFEPVNFSQSPLLEEIRDNPEKLDLNSKAYFEKTNTKLFPKRK